MAAKGPNRKALDQTLRAQGDLEPVEVQLLRSLADAVDAAPTRAALWEQYRAALREVLGARADADEFDAFLRSLGQAPVRDPADRPAEPRS